MAFQFVRFIGLSLPEFIVEFGIFDLLFMYLLLLVENKTAFTDSIQILIRESFNKCKFPDLYKK